VRIKSSNRPDTGENKKLQILKEIYGFFDIEQSIVFVTTQAEAEEVANMFIGEQFTVSFLHGKLQPSLRDIEMKNFREGKTKVLVTTNVLARGVDVPSVDVVVNYNLPTKPEVGNKCDPLTYLHRMGRCGRFGRRGTAISLLETEEDEQMMLTIENYFGYATESTAGVTQAALVAAGVATGQEENGDQSMRRMTVEWNANDIAGLAEAAAARNVIVGEAVELQTRVEVSEEIS
jgi:superfamily II DNA/RNA helicase